jgi:hypothetical protein
VIRPIKKIFENELSKLGVHLVFNNFKINWAEDDE